MEVKMITLYRFKHHKKGVFGVLIGDGIGTFFTLENPNNLLTTDVYDVVMDYSPKFKSDRPHIWNVMIAATRGFRIHEGNTVEDSQGCILVGNQCDLVSKKILDSKKALTQICSELTKLGKTQLVIKDISCLFS